MADILLHILAVVAAMAVSAGIALPVFVWIWKWRLRSEARSGWFHLYIALASTVLALITLLCPPLLWAALIDVLAPGPLYGIWIWAACCIASIFVTVIVYFRRYYPLIQAMDGRLAHRKNWN